VLKRFTSVVGCLFGHTVTNPRPFHGFLNDTKDNSQGRDMVEFACLLMF
jgi:hypothetical protein